MLQINDNMSIALTIGGVEYGLDQSTFESICTVQNIRTILPTCKIILNDIIGFFSSVSLSDGMPITITMGRGKDDPDRKTYLYNLVGDPKMTGIGNGNRVELTGILGNVKYLRDKPMKGYTGSSSEVIQQIADECGLEADVDDTNDSMDWFSGTLCYGHFAQQLSDLAYADDNSCFMVGVTEDSKLLFKNITTLPDKVKKPIPYYYQTLPGSQKDKVFKIRNSRWNQASGMTNMLYGYNYSYSASNINGEDVNIDKMQFKRNYSNKLDVNVAAVNDLTNMRTEYAPPDCGNYHENYYKAKYQNKRMRCMYSTDFIIQVYEYTGQQLLDIVNAQDIQGTKVDPSIQTSFLVTAKTRFVSNQLQYIEQLVLTTTGKNTSNNNLI